jgi:hypothetical protein
VKVGGQVKFACVDGPDFDGHQVDFEDLMSRLRRFNQAEQAAMERWSESCRMKHPIVPGSPGLLPPDQASEPLELPDPFEEARGG